MRRDTGMSRHTSLIYRRRENPSSLQITNSCFLFRSSSTFPFCSPSVCSTVSNPDKFMNLRRHTSHNILLAVDESLRFSNAPYPSHVEPSSSPLPKDRKTLESANILVFAPSKHSATSPCSNKCASASHIAGQTINANGSSSRE